MATEIFSFNIGRGGKRWSKRPTAAISLARALTCLSHYPGDQDSFLSPIGFRGELLGIIMLQTFLSSKTKRILARLVN
jgi:hypothetical protein